MFYEVLSAMSMLITVFLGVNQGSLIANVSDKATSTSMVVALCVKCNCASETLTKCRHFPEEKKKPCVFLCIQ